MSKRPREGRSSGFRPTVQSERVMFSWAGGGRAPGRTRDSAFARVARVIESVWGVGFRMVESLSSQGLKTWYSKLRL
jgi:hypothetical protein